MNGAVQDRENTEKQISSLNSKYIVPEQRQSLEEGLSVFCKVLRSHFI